ncbi:hypothetical protein MES4922_160235 [Mesorhizobium ventifaucium]|uniref:Uncharacterized protein n=1 Tax=Mesorhizobium ventifaucium TaxID=666020 RepID=A0ABM9DIN1_9HYPH|nr:hypothetical protein MES4922_160235 [Mesorhizobium ventifaucium]
MMDCFNHLIVLCNQTIYTSHKAKRGPLCARTLPAFERAIFAEVDRLLYSAEYSAVCGRSACHSRKINRRCPRSVRLNA